MIFRQSVQKSLQNLGLKIESKDVKIKDVNRFALTLWRKVDPSLKKTLRNLYKVTSEIKFFDPLIPTNDVLSSDLENLFGNLTLP